MQLIKDKASTTHCGWRADGVLREDGGIGRRTGFRFQRGNPWGFDSPSSYFFFFLVMMFLAGYGVVNPAHFASRATFPRHLGQSLLIAVRDGTLDWGVQV